MRILPALLVLVLAGCGGSSTEEGPDAGPRADAPDAGPGADAPAGLVCRADQPDPGFAYPVGPYGVDVGDVLEPFAFMDCGGAAVSLADVLSQAELVLVTVSTGWCPRCIAEAQIQEADLNQAYCGDGLRMITILTETASSAPADPAFCAQWRDAYGLTFPVLIDPAHATDPYFDGGAQPLTLLVDRGGVIRYRSVSQRPPGLPAAIEAALAR